MTSTIEELPLPDPDTNRNMRSAQLAFASESTTDSEPLSDPLPP